MVASSNSFVLHPFQGDLAQQIRSAVQSGYRRILVQAPTGAGKTVLSTHVMGGAQEKGSRSWFIVHRRELVKQSIDTFNAAGISHGVIAADFKRCGRPLIQIASIGTLGRRLDDVAAPKIIVWDECHHLAANTWAAIFAAYPDAIHIGFTATPKRKDGNGLGKYFEILIQGPSVAQLIEDGYLSPFRYFCPSTVDLVGVRTQMGDFNKKQLNSVMDKPSITGDAISHYKKLAMGKSAVVFAVNVQRSIEVVEQFNRNGVRAQHVDGTTPTKQRDKAVDLFKQGKIDVLSNVDLFGEGFDLPSLEVAILLRPTQSLAVYLQQCGRALRTHPGKSHAIILDHVGNAARHGLPDESREWSLEYTKRKKAGDQMMIKTCPKCLAANRLSRKTCSECGATFPKRPREVEDRDGELVEVTKEEKARIRAQHVLENRAARTIQDFEAIAQRRGYNPSWASRMMQSRQPRKAPV